MISETPDISQRDMARSLGVSLGGVHGALRALIEARLVRADRAAGLRRGAHRYALTPAGRAEKADLTRSFLARKRAEEAALRAEIAALEADLAEQQLPLAPNNRTSG